MANTTTQNDPADTFTANADLHWSKFNTSTLNTVTNVSLPVKLIDVPASPTGSAATRDAQLSNAQSLANYLYDGANASYKCRLISICQQNSWAPLQATKDMIHKIMSFHAITPSFLEVPLSFSYQSTDEEQGYSVPWSVHETGSAIEMYYTFRYAEAKGKLNEPWVVRQTGVYHRYDVATKSSLWILVSPVPDSAAEKRVREALVSYQERIESDPLWLHSVIHASYFGHWRDYLAAYEKILLPIADTTTATFITATLRVNHETLGKVRSIESRFLPVKGVLENFVDISHGLEKLYEKFELSGTTSAAERWNNVRRLSNTRRQAVAYIRTAQFLQRRSNNTATLLADTLAFKNQGVAQEQNISMLKLTRSAVFLTVLTLLYLPWTFVAGIFGMNFFRMDEKTSRLVTSPMLWIYVVTSVILTLTTMALYYCIAGRVENSTKAIRNSNEIPSMNLTRGYSQIEGNVLSKV